MSVPRTTHQWLQPLYNFLEGKVSRHLQFGSSTGVIGLYGSTGLAPILASGTAGITGWTGPGSPSGILWFNGGTGNYYTQNDIVLALKNIGILKP